MAVAAALNYNFRPQLRRFVGHRKSKRAENSAVSSRFQPLSVKAHCIKDSVKIDPCMGSGHILIAMFDVLMDIYLSVGYGERDAEVMIVTHNIHGLDIDKRAYQLAYFAVMMKGRGCSRRFQPDILFVAG